MFSVHNSFNNFTTDEPVNTKTWRYNASFKICTSGYKYSSFSQIFQWKNLAMVAFMVTASLRKCKYKIKYSTICSQLLFDKY